MKMINSYINGFVLSDKYYNFFIFLIVGCILGYKFVDKMVIGVPISIYIFYIFFTFFALVILVRKDSFDFINFIKLLFVNYLMFYLFVYLLFCLTSIIISSNHDLNVVSCPLIGSTSSLRNNAVYYRLDSSDYRLNAYGKVVSDLSKEKNYSDYYLNIKYRRGLLGSKIIKGTELVDKRR